MFGQGSLATVAEELARRVFREVYIDVERLTYLHHIRVIGRVTLQLQVAVPITDHPLRYVILRDH